MDIYNIIKIIAAIITLILAVIAGVYELRLNPDYWLNRWFFAFFISAALGFIAYTAYHLITFNSKIIIPIMITAQIFFNFIPISLVMTVFILEKYEKVAMSIKYLGTMIALFIIISFGYFIWVPTLDDEAYAQGNVNTKTELSLQISVNLVRIILLVYVVYKYAMITRKIGEETKNRIQWFFAGIIFVIIGLFINLAGGMFGLILLEISALIAIDVGMVLIFKGFLI